jgi:hypothetical protein
MAPAEGAAEAAKGTAIPGRCLCGAVRFSAIPKGDEVGACHCSMCRKWTAGPFFAMECGGSVTIEGDSNLARYRSSELAERMFCKQCGTSLFYKIVGKDFYVVSAEAFDEPGRFRFTTQIFIDEKPAYYEFANRTKNMTGAEVFAAFAASQAGDAPAKE